MSSTAAYACAGVLAVRRYQQLVAVFFLGGAGLCALLIGQRWVELDQGPFISMYEVLVSGIFGLSLLYGLAHISQPAVRVGAPVVALVLVVMGLWALYSDPSRIPLPASYGNPWLWVHLVFGKLFLGTCLVASSIAASLMLKPRDQSRSQVLTDRAWQWLTYALLFHSGMLVSGAVWAQDAWGRYWSWDPLETWAFATWLAMAAALHARLSLSLSLRMQQTMIVGVFILAFVTFFGVPFVTLAPHKGAI